jgi:hypothetical protein
MKLVNDVFYEVFAIFSRMITGRLFSEEQISAITTDAVGKYFADFFPTPKEEEDAKKKVNDAQEHIAAASEIILEMQDNLTSQNEQLTLLLGEIE